jgi:hypothetical protein
MKTNDSATVKTARLDISGSVTQWLLYVPEYHTLYVTVCLSELLTN